MKYALIVLLAILAGAGAFWVISDNDETPNASQASNSEVAQTGSSANTEQVAETSLPEESRYIDYSFEAVEQNSDKDVVIFFHAAWCPNCRALEETLTSNDIPDDILILKADYDEETELKQKYGVTQQTTMVHVDENGEKLNLWVATAYDDIEDVKANIVN